MKLCSRFRPRAAFTLTELVIAMALSLLVAGLVTSYILFATRFNARGQAAYARVEQAATLRREIDTWFSFADSAGGDITVQEGAVSVTVEGVAYGISWSEGAAEFTYPPCGAFARAALRVPCSDIAGLAFYAEGDNTSAIAGENEGLRFTVQAPLGGELYACELIYA